MLVEKERTIILVLSNVTLDFKKFKVHAHYVGKSMRANRI